MSSIYEDIVSLSEDIVQGRLQADPKIVTRLTEIATKVDEVDSKSMRISWECKKLIESIEEIRDRENQIREELY